MRTACKLTRSITVLALVVVAGLAVTATSAAARVSPEPWQPVTQQAFTTTAGSYCTFAFSYQPDRQHIEGRVLSRYPDGTVQAEEYRGLLIGTTTNLSTGESITRNSSGRAIEQYRADGTLATYTTIGPVGFGFHAGDNYPQGYYQLHGVHRISISPDGTRTMTLDRGSEENICETLS